MSRKIAESQHSHSKEGIRTWLRLLSCEKSIEQELRSRFRGHFTVTLPQFDVLAELKRAGRPLTMSQLSSELMVSNGNITGVVDRLEKGGLVSRDRCNKDRRVQFIALTPLGAKQFQQMARRHEKWLAELFSELTVTDMDDLQKLLLKARRSATTGTAA
jgi:DNA-binding MarR family transcriptional regulator